MIDLAKHAKGDVVRVHCCDSCALRSGVIPQVPADSGVESWPCEVCGHYGIGSTTDCEVGDWLRLRPLPATCDMSPYQTHVGNDDE
jgi:hypothetical protein